MGNTISRGIGGHQRAFRGRTDDWITPKWILEALGEFDLDPCASLSQPWPTARQNYTIKDDGMSKEWFGRVYLNSPYGPETGRWLERLAIHGNGVALTFARTETKMFFDSVWGRANGILFIKGRLYFHYPDGTKSAANSGGPSVLIAYGENNCNVLKNCKIEGQYLTIKQLEENG